MKNSKVMESEINQKILQHLTMVEEQLKKQNLLQKTIMVIEEAAEYLTVSTSYLYKLTGKKLIEHFKQGRKIYLRREALDKWMLSNRVKTTQEVKSNEATEFYLKKK